MIIFFIIYFCSFSSVFTSGSGFISDCFYLLLGSRKIMRIRNIALILRGPPVPACAAVGGGWGSPRQWWPSPSVEWWGSSVPSAQGPAPGGGWDKKELILKFNNHHDNTPVQRFRVQSKNPATPRLRMIWSIKGSNQEPTQVKHYWSVD